MQVRIQCRQLLSLFSSKIQSNVWRKNIAEAEIETNLLVCCIKPVFQRRGKVIQLMKKRAQEVSILLFHLLIVFKKVPSEVEGGSTALYTAYTVCLYRSNCVTLLKQQHLCLYIIRTLLEWTEGSSKKILFFLEIIPK